MWGLVVMAMLALYCLWDMQQTLKDIRDHLRYLRADAERRNDEETERRTAAFLPD